MWKLTAAGSWHEFHCLLTCKWPIDFTTCILEGAYLRWLSTGIRSWR
jgi:hypothetical protein